MSIYGRMLIPYVLSLAVGSIAAWWLASALVAEALHARLEEDLKRAVAHLAQGRLPIAPDLMTRLGALIGGELTLIPRAPAGDGVNAVAALPPAVAEALRQGGDSGRYRVRVGAIPYSVVIEPLGVALKPRYAALAASAPLTEIDAASRRIAVLLGALALAGTLVLSWIAHRAARDITRPLQALGVVAGRIATGDLAARSATQGRAQGPQELRALGHALDDMAERLAAYQADAARRSRLSALGELSARVAHEVRNPLTAIRLHVELLAETLNETSANAAQSQTCERLLKEIDRLELVVATTLGLARPPGSALSETDPNTLVAEVAALLGPQLAHRRIRLDLDPGTVPPARLDADGLRQVLLNLVNNASDALASGGIIRVGTALEGETATLVLTVDDSGPGLPIPDTDLFERGGSAKPHGLGLGLAISREICEAMGGTIVAEQSQGLGGARFLVRLPMVPQADLHPIHSGRRLS